MTSAMLGVHLSILAGTTLPVPLPADVTARVRDVTVTESDDDRTAFTISFDAGRSGPIAVFDTPMLIDSPVKGNARVVVTLTMGATPSILVDGIVTQTRLVPGSATRRTELSVTGHDVSVLLDRHEYSVQHPLDDAGQVQNIANKYRTQGIVSNITDPPKSDRPAPNGRIPTQQDTDWAHLQWLAYCHGYVCYFSPGPTPGVSTLYWGPPKRVGVPQPALSVDLGPETNVTGSPEFSQDVLEPEFVDGEVQDSDLGAVPVRTVSSIRPPLAAEPVWAVQEPNVRVRQYRESGGDAVRALDRARRGPIQHRLRYGDRHRRRIHLRLCAAAARPGGHARGGLVQRRAVVRTPSRAPRRPRQLHRRFHAHAGGLRLHALDRRDLVMATEGAIAGPRRRFYGKYRGTVTDNADAFGLGRVLVTCPAVYGTGENWAMPCTPYAGSGVGLFLLPPIGAHAWVEFEGGDPDYPIAAGYFWSDDSDHRDDLPASPRCRPRSCSRPNRSRSVWTTKRAAESPSRSARRRRAPRSASRRPAPASRSPWPATRSP